ncbi:hypothetical protein [Kitasatospora sp. NPDC002965]|uniref:hypothetical protein n=1 Tax=Kitasatospora sp. NPDC002965 TaxID=3154775 RepID=UPI0033B7F26B
MSAGPGGAPPDPGRFLQAPAARPVLRLVLADPAGAAGGVLPAAMGPELAVEPLAGPLDGAEPWSVGAGRWPLLPWALLAVAGAGPGGAAVLADAVRAVRAAGAAGRPPAGLLLCPSPDAAAPPLEAGAEADGPLPCPVVVLARDGDGSGPAGTGTGGAADGAVAAWRRLAPEAFTVRLLGPAGWSDPAAAAETARTVKEELHIWPA